MNYRLTLYLLGGLLIFLAVMLLLPVPVALWYGDGQTWIFFAAAGATGGIGYWLLQRFRNPQQLTLREGFAVVTFAWLAFALFGSLPFLLSSSLPSPIDAFFEAMSGFTTCGASVYTDVEAVPRSLLFWRALTQWIGGMGVIVLGVAVLPLLGVGGMHLFEAESAGLSPSADRLTPRIQDTARLLWGVYALITAGSTALLVAGEMDFFDALCHTFSAISSGGFSTRNRSVGAFGPYSQLVLMMAMLLGTINFSLHYFALRGRLGRYWSSVEVRWYLWCWLILLVTTFLANALYWRYEDWASNLLDSAFTVTSVLTTTGFATADYETWPPLALVALFLGTFIGGCAGSTAGGLKQIRLVILLRQAGQQLRRQVHPQQVVVLKVDGRPIPHEVIRDVLGFTVLFLGVFLVATLVLAATDLDLITASTAAGACLTTLGPGLGTVGPTDNYAHLSPVAKLVLCAVMLLGRLEVTTVLVLFMRDFWRK